MPTYSRSVRVDAPLERVWAVHDDLDGLDALTPSVVGLRVESVTGPDGEPAPTELVPGTEIALSVRPFGVGPTPSLPRADRRT